jgi:hypothetical protein
MTTYTQEEVQNAVDMMLLNGDEIEALKWAAQQYLATLQQPIVSLVDPEGVE